MRPAFHARLVNGPFDDPGLLISFLYADRSILFDLGDLHALSSKEILKVGHVFVTHTHMDHFVGFDHVLRLMMGRKKTLCLYGPKGFLKNVEGKLAGYAWNLVHNYDNRFSLEVFEIRSDLILHQTYRCIDRFTPRDVPESLPFDPCIFSEPAFGVSAAILDHDIPCLGFCLSERFHVNIKKDAVLDLGLDIGPWINTFKKALYDELNPNSEFIVSYGNKGGLISRSFMLKDLAGKIAVITPGQKIAYIADVAYHAANVEKIIGIAKNSDHLFIEAAFLEEHQDIAAPKKHLTARQAGLIAKAAHVKRFTIFHFSPRYEGREDLLLQEARKAFEER